MKTDLFNGLALLVCLGLASLGALWVSERPASTTPPADPAAPLPPSGPLIDARGNAVAPGAYQRIVSLNPVADFLLEALVEPSRLVGVSAWSVHQHPDGWRLGSSAPVDAAGQLEAVLALKPDLVVASPFIDPAKMQWLAETGVPVFDTGDPRGIATTLRDIALLSRLVGEPARGARLAARVQSEVAGLDARVAGLDWPEGMYMSVYGDTFFGGTAETSYADLLRMAGVTDLAAARGLTGWPQLTAEQVLVLNPSLLVTPHGMRPVICGHTIIGSIDACLPGGRVIELDGQYHADPGLGLLHAARDLQAKVHPR